MDDERKPRVAVHYENVIADEDVEGVCAFRNGGTGFSARVPRQTYLSLA